MQQSDVLLKEKIGIRKQIHENGDKVNVILKAPGKRMINNAELHENNIEMIQAAQDCQEEQNKRPRYKTELEKIFT